MSFIFHSQAILVVFLQTNPIFPTCRYYFLDQIYAVSLDDQHFTCNNNNVFLPWLLFLIKICQKSLANTDDDDILENTLVLIIS